MGKRLLPVNGKPLIQHIAEQLVDFLDEVIIGANDTEKYGFLNLRVVPDMEMEKGPLMGIYSCLLASDSDINFITACDIPEMNIELVSRMANLALDYEIVMPVNGSSRFEPLFAVYRKSVAAKAKLLLDGNRQRTVELLDCTEYATVDFTGNGWYQNLNCASDYFEYVGR